MIARLCNHTSSSQEMKDILDICRYLLDKGSPYGGNIV